MNSFPLYQLALVTPAILLCLAASATLLWHHQRQHRYLLWLAASQMLMAVALTAQTLLRSEHAFVSAWWIAALYISAAVATLQTMAGRLGQRLRTAPVMLLAVGGMGSVGYFLLVQPHVAARITALSLCCAAIMAYGVPRFLRTPKRHGLERLSVAVYLVCVLLTGLRPALIDWGQGSNVPASPVWWFALLHILVMSVVLTLCLGASALLDTIHTLRVERDIDSLTGIWNRRALEEACAPVPSTRGVTSLITLDLDHFKRINDRYGHAAGDEVLHHVGAVLRNKLHEGDMVARVGGEEFIMALHRKNPQHALQLAHSIAQTIEESPRWHQLQLACPVTISAGVVRVRLSESLTQALSRADALLYKAKRTGRNRVYSDGARH